MANKRVIELSERTEINLNDWLLIDDQTGTRKLSMSTMVNYLSYSAIIFVAQLPTTDIDPNMLYLVPHTGSQTQFDEYVYRENQWKQLGISTLDLTGVYQVKTDNNLQTTAKTVVGAINEVNSNKQNSTDNSLATTSKTVVGAINELNTLAVHYTRVAIEVNTAASVGGFSYKGSKVFTTNPNAHVVGLAVEHPAGNDWIFSVSVNDTTKEIKLFSNGSTNIIVNVAYMVGSW